MSLTVRCSLLVAWLASGAAALDAQSPRLSIAPARPLPGALVTITLSNLGTRDSVVAIDGTMAGEPLHFAAAHGVRRAIGAVPVDSTNVVRATVVVEPEILLVSPTLGLLVYRRGHGRHFTSNTLESN